jgi:class 3 adenylate cyclase
VSRKPKRLTSDQFFDVLRKRTKRNAQRIDKEIEQRSLDDVTVMMVDSSGFTRKTHAYGILQFLAVMTHCYDRIIPRLEARGGITLSRNADNIVALFEKPEDAVGAAIDMQQWLLKRNIGKHDSEQYSVCIGINSGTVVRLADNIYGDMVNIAAKLGEDVAAKDQILVTGVVAERVGKRFDIKYDHTIEIGKEVVALHEVQYEAPKAKGA